jgi:hypothetical protein
MALETLTPAEALVAAAAASVAAACALAAWLRHVASRTASDPWPRDVDLEVRDPGCVPLCVSCLLPQPGRPWLCPRCAYPSGDYVTLMPYLQNFALGELFRRGVAGPTERGFGRAAILVLLSAGEYQLFAPVYWFWMYRKARGRPICQARPEPLAIEDAY